MKTKGKGKQSYKIVRETIHAIDPFGLLESGSPENEFDSEILAITKQLNRCKSGRDISHAIARVLNSSFYNTFEPDSFLEESEKAYKKLKEKGII